MQINKTLSFYRSFTKHDRYIDEAGRAVNAASEAITVIRDLDAFLNSQGLARMSRDRFRKKFKKYSELPAYLAEGETEANILGSYIIGEKFGQRNPVTKKRRAERRLLGQEIYAEALVRAVSDVCSEMGIHKTETNDYENLEKAAIAHMVESLGSKGPYDNGKPDTAIKVSQTLLDSGTTDNYPTDEEWETILLAVARREEEYRGVINPNFTGNTNSFDVLMANRGLRDSMRGFPFMAPGNSVLHDSHVVLTEWIFQGSDPNFTINRNDIERIRSEQEKKYQNASEEEKMYGLISPSMSVDMFIDYVLQLFHNDGILFTKLFNLRHTIIFPINRNQGSGFKVKTDDFQNLKLTGDRKDLKYRLVTPVGAFTNAYIFKYCSDLIDNAPNTEQRIGLSNPSDNARRLMNLLKTGLDHDIYYDPIDYSNFDQGIRDWELILWCGVYASLYNDKTVQDAFKLMALALSHKLLAIPTNTSIDASLKSYTHGTLRSIKGDAKYARERQDRDRPIKRTEKDDQMKDFDYRCSMVYLYDHFLTSGAFPTNAIGSDISNTDCCARVPFKLGMLPKGKLLPVKVTTSGDDILLPLFRDWLAQRGLGAMRSAISDAFEKIGKVAKAEKQSPITIQGIPLVIYLQEMRSQVAGEIEKGGMKNFLRQKAGEPYSERPVKLPPTLQWTIVLSKADSGVDEKNIDFATEVCGRHMFYLHELAKKYRFRPSISPGLKHASEALAENSYMMYDSSSTLDRDESGGYKVLMQLVAKYGQEFYSELGKWASKKEAFVSALAEQLEAKAPHKAGIWQAVKSKLGDQFNELFNFHGEKQVESYHSYGIELFMRVKDKFYGHITPLELLPVGWGAENLVEVEPEGADFDDSYDLGSDGD